HHHVFDVALSRSKLSGRRHHVFDVALSRSKLRGSGLVRECSISATAYASDVPAFSRTSPLLQKSRFFSKLQVV
ncbi:hypothetical protein, partial [Pseudomonas viridiflava]|uniref:hypothetical protein n=1 Tax=Pseudomonas viridiflava TaxID=33069 RepID=UPI00198105AB